MKILLIILIAILVLFAIMVYLGFVAAKTLNDTEFKIENDGDFN